MPPSKWTVETDGGSPVNPGPSSYAFVVKDQGKTIMSRSGYLPHATNNVAEYAALTAACYFLLNLPLGGPDLPEWVEFWSDSQLIVRQITGVYRVNDEALRPAYQEAKDAYNALSWKTRVSIEWFRRENNTEADELCNLCLERHGYVFANKSRKPKALVALSE